MLHLLRLGQLESLVMWHRSNELKFRVSRTYEAELAHDWWATRSIQTCVVVLSPEKQALGDEVCPTVDTPVFCGSKSCTHKRSILLPSCSCTLRFDRSVQLDSTSVHRNCALHARPVKSCENRWSSPSAPFPSILSGPVLDVGTCVPGLWQNIAGSPAIIPLFFHYLYR